jgi:hypothetical protein
MRCPVRRAKRLSTKERVAGGWGLGRKQGSGGGGNGGKPGASASGVLNRRGEEIGDLTQFGARLTDYGCGRIGIDIGAQSQVGSDERSSGRSVHLELAQGLLLCGRTVTVNLVKGLAGAGKGIPLGVDEALDFQGQFDFAAAIKALAGSAFVGLELGELCLPEAKDVGFKLADAGYVANLEVETVGDGRRVLSGFVGELGGHS